MNVFDRASSDGVSGGLAELRTAVTDAPPPDIAAEHLDAIFAAQDAACVARVRSHRTTVAMISGSAVAAVLLVASIGLRVPPRPTAVETASPSIETIEVDVRRAIAARMVGDDPEKPTGVAAREANDIDTSHSAEAALSVDRAASGQGNDVSVSEALSHAGSAGQVANNNGGNGESANDRDTVGHTVGGTQTPRESGPPAHANGAGAPEPGSPPTAGNQAADPGNDSGSAGTPAPGAGDDGRPDPTQISDDVPLETVLADTPLESAMCDGLVATILGSNGPDVIVGTDGPDVIVAGNGADIVHALGGDDVVCGGNGSDIVFGGEGDDRLLGGNGIDQLIDDLGSNDIEHGLDGSGGPQEIPKRP